MERPKNSLKIFSVLIFFLGALPNSSTHSKGLPASCSPSPPVLDIINRGIGLYETDKKLAEEIFRNVLEIYNPEACQKMEIALRIGDFYKEKNQLGLAASNLAQAQMLETTGGEISKYTMGKVYKSLGQVAAREKNNLKACNFFGEALKRLTETGTERELEQLEREIARRDCKK